MREFFRVERNAALLLLLSALAGLLVANGPLKDDFLHLTHLETLIGLDVADLVSEGLMTGFFLLVGLELKHEFTEGVFRRRRALAIPGLAALLGALIPAGAYFGITMNDAEMLRGWGIPMATDLTFALAVFAVFGRALPRSARTFVLSFAVLDDLLAVLVIALFVGSSPNPLWIALAALALAGFWFASKIGNRPLMLVVAASSWYFLLLSGIQPAIIGVFLGLLLQARQASRLEKAIHPWISLAVLPIFALISAAVTIDESFQWMTPVVLAVLIRPIGKFVGILAGAVLARRFFDRSGFAELKIGDFAALASLGGIGFSVALLIANQTFGPQSALATQAIVATLIAMLVSIAVAAVALTSRGKR